MKRWLWPLAALMLAGCSPAPPPPKTLMPVVTDAVEAPSADAASTCASPPPATENGWQQVVFDVADVAIEVPDDMPPLFPRPDGWVCSSNEHLMVLAHLTPWKSMDDVEKAAHAVMPDFKLTGKPTAATTGAGISYQSQAGVWNADGQKLGMVLSAYHIKDHDFVMAVSWSADKPEDANPDVAKIVAGVTIAPETSDCETAPDDCPAPEDQSSPSPGE